MSIRNYLTSTLGLSHLFMLDDATRDPGSTGIVTTGSITAGQGSFVATPVCEGVNNSLQSITDNSSNTAVSNCFVIGNTADINQGTGIYQEYSILCWFRADDVSVPTCIYEQGGGTNNMAINVGIAKAITSQSADAGQPFLIAQSNFLAEANRNYFVTHVWQRHTQHAGAGNRIILYINGVQQEIVEFDGTDAFPNHSGDIVVGNSNDNLQSYNGSTQRFVARQKNVNMLGILSGGTITETQSREIFERSVIPEITIAADTVANQQAALDVLSSNTYQNLNCAIRIVQATDATDYRLFIDNISFVEDLNLRDIAIQYVGANTLTLENANGSNVVEISTPTEVDLDGTTILTGGGTINIVEDTVRVNTVSNQSNVFATKIVIEQAGVYNFTNVNVSEIENVSGGSITVTTDTPITVVTDTGTGSITTLVDAFLSFDGIDNWELYSSEADRDANTNLLANGTGSDTYVFPYTGSDTFYIRAVSSATTFLLEETPASAGETVVSLTTQALLLALQSQIVSVDYNQIESIVNNQPSIDL